MTIRYVKGDIVRAKEEMIAHGCNAMGVMGSGVAKAIRAQWPEAYETYRARFEQNKGLKLGEVVAVFVDDKEKIICNAVTQEFFGRDGLRYMSYVAIVDSFREIRSLMKRWKIKQIAIPRIGAGLGGGDWNVISALIEEIMIGYDVVVYDI